MKTFATVVVVAAISMGSFLTASPALADDCRGCGVGGPAGPVGPNPVVGPAGPVGVGGVVGPVGVDPVAVAYAIPNGYPMAPTYPGELPCYTPDGQPYYTPGADPCLCFAPTGAVVPC